MAYAVELTARAEREFARLPPPVQRSIARALPRLAADPREAANVKKLVGIDGFRLRVGDWRVLFQFDHSRHRIVVLTIGNRRDVYRRS